MPRLRRDDEARRRAATATRTKHESPKKNDADEPPKKTRSGPTADFFAADFDASRKKMSSFASAVLGVFSLVARVSPPAAAASHCGTKRGRGAFSVRVRVRV